MNSPVRRPAAAKVFVGSEANLKRLVRIGWKWEPKKVEAFKKKTRARKPIQGRRPPVIMSEKEYSEYRRSLSAWFGDSLTLSRGGPLGSDGGELGSGGGALGSGGGPLGSGGGPLGSGGGSLGAKRKVGLGYHPDLPDWRDYQLKRSLKIPENVERILADIQSKNLGLKPGAKRRIGKDNPSRSFLLSAIENGERDALPEYHDLRYTGYFSPIEDQGTLGSCTAQAVIGLVEYLQLAGSGEYDDMSRLFNYKTSRRLLEWTGDTGSYLRTAIKALALFGAPPERVWPYIVESFEDEPQAYHYAYGANFKALDYTRLDGKGTPVEDALDFLKRTLLDGFPVVFGFTVFDSIDEISWANGFVIPFPGDYDKAEGGHAVIAVGYDDTYLNEPYLPGGSRGVVIIRNSWGMGWGEAGYGYLPQDYITHGLAQDFWTIFNQDWFRQSVFE